MESRVEGNEEEQFWFQGTDKLWQELKQALTVEL